jgi:hypothetical protein
VLFNSLHEASGYARAPPVLPNRELADVERTVLSLGKHTADDFDVVCCQE